MALTKTTVELSPELKVEIAPLTTKESMFADQIIGAELGENISPGALALLTTKIYALCSVRSINGIIKNPLAGGAAYYDVRDSFGLMETMTLADKLSDISGLNPDKVKNSSTEGGSTTAPLSESSATEASVSTAQ